MAPKSGWKGSRLEVNGPVLDLEQDVGGELAVERLERVIGGRGPIGAGLGS